MSVQPNSCHTSMPLFMYVIVLLLFHHSLYTFKVVRAVPTGENTANATGTSQESDEHGTASDSSTDEHHVYGDIVRVRNCVAMRTPSNIPSQMIPTSYDNLRHQPFLTVSGAVFNSNTDDGCFDINAPQYTKIFKAQRHLATFPIRATFDDVCYKRKKPVPSNNTYVVVDGFLDHIEFDHNAHPSLFHVSIDTIGFLGRATTPARTQCNQR